MGTVSQQVWVNCRKSTWVQILRHVHNKLGNDYKAALPRKNPRAKYD